MSSISSKQRLRGKVSSKYWCRVLDDFCTKFSKRRSDNLNLFSTFFAGALAWLCSKMFFRKGIRLYRSLKGEHLVRHSFSVIKVDQPSLRLKWLSTHPITVNSRYPSVPPSFVPVKRCTHCPLASCTASPSAFSPSPSFIPTSPSLSADDPTAPSPYSGSFSAGPYSNSQTSCGIWCRGMETLNVRWRSNETWSGEYRIILPTVEEGVIRFKWYKTNEARTKFHGYTWAPDRSIESDITDSERTVGIYARCWTQEM